MFRDNINCCALDKFILIFFLSLTTVALNIAYTYCAVYRHARWPINYTSYESIGISSVVILFLVMAKTFMGSALPFSLMHSIHLGFNFFFFFTSKIKRFDFKRFKKCQCISDLYRWFIDGIHMTVNRREKYYLYELSNMYT